MKLDKLLVEFIESEIKDGYINKNKHPHADLWILNYSKSTQYAWRWNSATSICRGLIVDAEYNVIAMGYPKFFSFEQLEDKSEIPMHEEARVYDKADGSLGVLYFLEGIPYIATRGSFESEMAIEATKILNTKYSHITWNPRYTYLFEIIYPDNRIVVDYGDTRDLILHGVIDHRSGEDIVLHKFYNIAELKAAGVSVIKEYEIGNAFQGFEELVKMYPYDGQEGFVVRFESGYRVKIKYEEYKNLAYIKDATTNKKLFTMIEEGTINDIIDAVPAEQVPKIKSFEVAVRTRFVEIRAEYNQMYCSVEKQMHPNDKRPKAFAAEVKRFQKNLGKRINPRILFDIRSGNEPRIESDIWKMLKEEVKSWPQFNTFGDDNA